MNCSVYQKLFLLAALWNFIAGGGIVLAPEWVFQLFFAAELHGSQYYAAMLFQMYGLLVLVFGFGYYLVSRNIGENHGIVLMGVVGKTLVFIVCLVALLDGKVMLTGLSGAVGDLLWAFAFVYFLFQNRQGALSNRVG